MDLSGIISTADRLVADLAILREAAHALSSRLLERAQPQEHVSAEVATLANAADQVHTAAADHLISLGAAREDAKPKASKKAKARAGKKR